MAGEIRKIKAFITGYFLTFTFQDNPEAKRKRKICSSCKYRNGFRCGLCGCPLKPLSLANDRSFCDAGKWN